MCEGSRLVQRAQVVAVVVGVVVGVLFRLAYVALWRPPGSYAVMPESALILFGWFGYLIIAGIVGAIQLLAGRRSVPNVYIQAASAFAAWTVVSFLDATT